MALLCASVLRVTYGRLYPCPFFGMLVASGDKGLLSPRPACWNGSRNADAVSFESRSTSRISKRAQCEQTGQKNLSSNQRSMSAAFIYSRLFPLFAADPGPAYVDCLCALHTLWTLNSLGSGPISDVIGFVRYSLCDV